MKIAIYWFRNDLRIIDNPSLIQATKEVDYLLPIYIHETRFLDNTPWGFARTSELRQKFLRESLDDLASQLKKVNSDLFEFSGDPIQILIKLCKEMNINTLYFEDIHAPEEVKIVSGLEGGGLIIKKTWQSTMLDPYRLPFEINQLPDTFTVFRKLIEKEGMRFQEPIKAPVNLPPLPRCDVAELLSKYPTRQLISKKKTLFRGGTTAAQIHLDQYFQRRLPSTYKQTRNQLIGMDYSSKFSPWLANGSYSARIIAQRLDQYEQEVEANDSTYWLWFELLWRDYFRMLHLKYGDRLYGARGLSNAPLNKPDPIYFEKWSQAKTKEPFINAGMCELVTTGFLSNRMRQIVASYLIYDLGGDWRAGAAWFESHLLDFDVYSNQGNWLYIAGRGTDPRGGRPFNLQKQLNEHDPQRLYCQMWNE